MTNKKDEVTIKRNVIEQDLMIAKNFVKNNKKKVTLFSLLFLIVILGAASGFVIYNNVAEKNLNEYYGVVEKYRQNFSNKEAQDSAIKQLSELVEKSSIGIAIDLAYYELGNIYFDQKKYKKAADNFDAFINRSGDELLKPIVINKMSIALEEAGEIDKALKVLSEFDSENTKSIAGDQILYNLGRLYLQKGDKVKAKATFERVIKTFPDSLFAGRSKERIFLIDSK